MIGLASYDNMPISGCRGCETTGGRMGCTLHGGVFYSPASQHWLGGAPVVTNALLITTGGFSKQ